MLNTNKVYNLKFIRRKGDFNIVKRDYECEMNYVAFEDMKRYNPSFTEDLIKGKTDEEIRTMFKDFYLKHLPIDLLAWMRVFEPKNSMNYKKGYWHQTVFIRDEVNRLFYPEYKEWEANPVKVIAMHRSKSIALPVYYIYLRDYDTQITMRNNFYDWKISINSKYSITGIEEFFREEKEPINPIYCEGFEKSQVFGMYKKNNKRFTIELPCNEYNLYTFFYMLKKSLNERKR